jgi:hypothetical protein
MARKEVFSAQITRDKVGVTIKAQSDALGRLFQTQPGLTYTANDVFYSETRNVGSPDGLWTAALADGVSVTLESPLPASRLEALAEGLKRTATKLLREYATPFDAQITITRGEL